MSTNKSNKPELRFKGFYDDWEQRKLSDLVDVYSGMDYKHLSIGNIPVFGTGGYMLSVDRALSYDRNAIGIGRKGTIDKPYILKAPFWTVDTLFYCIPRDEGTLNFDYDLFQCIDWKQKDESTGVPSLSKVAINDTDVMVPKTDEQKKIGYFFEELDLVITLHQYKLYMGVYRKGTILTYFWEQRKLDEISAKYKNSIVDGPFGSDLKTADYTDTGVLVMQSNYITSGNFDIKQPYYVSEEKAKRLERCHCKGGDILIAKIGANFGICNIIPKNIEDAVLSSNCMKVDLDDEHDNNFYKQYFNILYESGYYYSLVGITAQPALSLKFIKSLVVPSPSFEEQKKISKYFINLDNLITLHQRKIKYILKEVFIWIILIKRVVLKKPLSLSYRIMVGRKKLLSILQNRI